jgi:hypothetical protein
MEDDVFRRFRWVIPGRLARSSAPYYNGRDEDQNMDQVAVDFLISRGINNIISLNSRPLSKAELDLLKIHGITYTHEAVEDFGTPTLAQLQTVNSNFASDRTTLVYCGYGQGRTGTAITALQLYTGRPLVENDFRAIGVETPGQIQALNELKDSLEK